jgi:hypothetical protein
VEGIVGEVRKGFLEEERPMLQALLESVEVLLLGYYEPGTVTFSLLFIVLSLF